jgi:predicted Ser/Thr protein kinase
MAVPEGMNLIGRMIGKYRIVREIGRGGMGVVYAAHQTELDRPVAIKVLAPHLAWERTFVDRFLHEARMAAKLNHPHIVTIYDVGQQDSIYYLVMRLVEGKSLKDILAQEGAMPLARTAGILAQLAEALDYAHSHGVIHRDVKPGNVLVERGDQVTLTDFGIARAAEGTRLTATGIALGTPEYMSPEQALGQPTDARTDVYSLGIVLYEMLTGRVPFHADTPLATLMQQAQTPPPRPRSIVPSMPPEVEGVILKTLSKQPDGRYVSAGEFSHTLDRIVRRAHDERLRHQVAQAASWIKEGHYDRAVVRLEALAQAYPDDKEIAALLAQARKQVYLSSLYNQVQQLWTQAEAKAGEILTASPEYPDPSGLLRRLLGRKQDVAVVPEEWPAWVTRAGTALVILGSLAAAALQRSAIQWGVSPAVCLLLVVLAVLSTWRAIPLRTRQVLAILNLALVLCTISLTRAIVPRPYLFSAMGAFTAVAYLLQSGVLLGSIVIFWALIVKRHTELASVLMVLGSLAVLLSYGLEWIQLSRLPWDRGYDIVYQQLYPLFEGNTEPRWIAGAYPLWLRSIVVLLPAMSILGGALSSLGVEDASPGGRKQKAMLGILFSGSALIGMLISGLPYFWLFDLGRPTWLFRVGYLGWWLMLVGLASILVGVILRGLPVLRTSIAGRKPSAAGPQPR